MPNGFAKKRGRFTESQSADGDVVIKFNLPPADSTHGAPPTSHGKFAQLIRRHRFKNVKLGPMRNEALRLRREDAGYLLFYGRKII
jgi:hypothetical protein